MNGANLLLLATGLVLTRAAPGTVTPAPTTVPPLNLTGWTPTCSGTTISFDTGTRFAGYYARVVTSSTNCTKNTSIDLTGPNVTIPQDCITQTNKSVVINFEPKRGNGQLVGGKDHTEVSITCSSVGKDGINVTANVTFNVTPRTAMPQPFTVPPAPTVKMELVEMTGSDINSAKAMPVVTLGQDNVYLKISGPDTQQLLLPTKCTGESPSKANTYVFFSANNGTNSCAYDDEVLSKFNFSTSNVPNAHFYPFMFVSGKTVTLTCEVLVCPKTTSTPGKCQNTKNDVDSCKPGAVTQTRRRRSARESEPDTHVVEVTYTVVGHDPALHGQTAAGAGMAVSIPLLAAVSSLWIL